MAVRMTGAQFKAFWGAEWGPNAMIEEEAVTVDGEEFDTCDGIVEEIPDASRVIMTGGIIIPDQMAHRQAEINAENFARKWLKAQTTVTLLVEVPREHADDFAERIGCLGRDGIKAKIVGKTG
jgi:hypothetical protein